MLIGLEGEGLNFPLNQRLRHRRRTHRIADRGRRRFGIGQRRTFRCRQRRLRAGVGKIG